MRPVSVGSALLPADPHTVALAVLAFLAVGYTLYFAKPILMPLAGALVLNFLLSPAVRRLKRMHVPPPLAAGVVLGLVAVVVIVIGSLLVGPISQWVERFPQVLRHSQSRFRGVVTSLEKVQKATQEIQDLTNGTRNNDSSEPTDTDSSSKNESNASDIPLANEPGPYSSEDYRPPEAVNANGEDIGAESGSDVIEVTSRPPSLISIALSTTASLLMGIFVAGVVLYFLLASEDRTLRFIVTSLHSFSAKKGVVDLARTMEQTISRFLLTYLGINVVLGIVIGTVMWAFGLPNPLLWGVLAGLLNFAPYVGFLVGAGLVALVSLDTFSNEPLWFCALPSATYIAINAMEGNFITPAIWGKSLQQSPIAILLSILFMGWIWGPAGVLLAVPMLMMFTTSLKELEHHLANIRAAEQAAEKSAQTPPPVESPNDERDADVQEEPLVGDLVST